MNVLGLVEAVSAGAGSAVVVGGAFRRYWTRREARQQAAFRRAVQDIVDQSVNDVLARQRDFEKRQGRHLDAQDRKLDALAALIDRNTQRPGGSP